MQGLRWRNVSQLEAMVCDRVVRNLTGTQWERLLPDPRYHKICQKIGPGLQPLISGRAR